MRIIRRPGQLPVVEVEPLVAAVDVGDEVTDTADDDEDRPTGLVVVARVANAESIAVEGGLPPDELHVTLGYYGDANEVGGDDIERLREWVDDHDFAEIIEARVGGVARMGDDEPQAIALLVEAAALNDLRATMADTVFPDVTHPHFTPHVTLGYGIDMPTELPTTVELDRVELWIAGEHYPAQEAPDD